MPSSELLSSRREPSVLLTVATLAGLALLACDPGVAPAASPPRTPPSVSSPTAAAPPAPPAASPATASPASPVASAPPAQASAQGFLPAAGLKAGDRYYDGCNWCEVQASGADRCTERACPDLRLRKTGTTTPAPALSAAEQAEVRQAAARFIKAVRARDGEALAALLSERGAHLSISPGFEEHVNAMSASEARDCFTRTERRDWGTLDPSEERTVVPCKDHLDGYLKIMTAPGVKVTFDTTVMPHGQGMAGRIQDHFPGAASIDYFLPGQGAQSEYSYHGVRLVFTRSAGGWKLAGALTEYYLP